MKKLNLAEMDSLVLCLLSIGGTEDVTRGVTMYFEQ